MNNNNNNSSTVARPTDAGSSVAPWLKKDLITLVTLNVLYLVGLIIIFQINQKNKIIENTIAGWVGF